MSQLQIPRLAPPLRRAKITEIVKGSRGFAAAEAVLLALLLSGMALMVSKVLVPGTQKAASNLNQELVGEKLSP